MATLLKLMAFLLCAALLQACNDPIQHPVIGNWEGESENIFGLELNKLTFSNDGTYHWTQLYTGLKETMEHRSPETDWGEVGYKVVGKFKITEGGVTFVPKKIEMFLANETFDSWPMVKIGHEYLSPYYFEDTELILIDDRDRQIAFRRI